MGIFIFISYSYYHRGGRGGRHSPPSACSNNMCGCFGDPLQEEKRNQIYSI